MKKKNKTFFDERGVKYSYLDNENSSDVKLVSCPRYIEGEFQTSERLVTIGANAFYGCKKVTSIKAYNLIQIENNAFAKSGLEKIEITKSVKSIGPEAFLLCKDLTKVTFEPGVESIGRNAFAESGIESISLPYTITSIGARAFQQCPNLKSIVLPEKLEEVPSEAFQGCEKLESVTFSLQKVTNIADYAFANCVALKFIKIPDSVIDLGNRSFKGCKNLLCATLPENVKTIGDEAFADCENLRQVVLPASIESIGANAFANCPKLESIMVQDIERFRKMEGLKVFFHWYFQEW